MVMGGSPRRVRIAPVEEAEAEEDEANFSNSNRMSSNRSSTVLFSIANRLKS